MNSTTLETQHSFFDHLFRPWERGNLSRCQQTAYAVASLGIGIITCFIIHIIYNVNYYLNRGNAEQNNPLPQNNVISGSQNNAVIPPVQNQVENPTQSFSIPTSPVGTPSPRDPPDNPLSTNPPQQRRTPSRSNPRGNALSQNPPLQEDFIPPLSFDSLSASSQIPPPNRLPFSAQPNNENTSSAMKFLQILRLLQPSQPQKRVNIPFTSPIILNLRNRQQTLPSPNPQSRVPTLSSLASRAIFFPERENSTNASTQQAPFLLFPGDFWIHNYELIRSSSFSGEKIKNAMIQWGGSNESLKQILLHGCTHLSLSPEIFYHTGFEEINLLGVPLNTPDTIVSSLIHQKDLQKLILGHDQTVKCSTFEMLLTNCKKLKTLSLSIDSAKDSLGQIESSVERLTLNIPSLDLASLKWILKANPKLKKLNIIANSITSDLYSKLKYPNSEFLFYELKTPISLINLTINIDQERVDREYAYQVDNSCYVVLTHSNTRNLFDASAVPVLSNFNRYAFSEIFLQNCYDPQKICIILKKIGMINISSEKIAELGKLVADSINLTDLQQLEKHYQASASIKPLNLEIFFRSALDFCQTKIPTRSEDIELSPWYQKRELFHLLLNKII